VPVRSIFISRDHGFCKTYFVTTTPQIRTPSGSLGIDPDNPGMANLLYCRDGFDLGIRPGECVEYRLVERKERESC